MATRRELLSLFSLCILPAGNGIESLMSQSDLAIADYWKDAESEFKARRVRVTSCRLRGAIKRAGIPDEWRVDYGVAGMTALCRAGKRGDPDFWIR